MLTEKTFLVFSTWGDSGAGEGNNTTSHKASNSANPASSKINSIHISIHIYPSLEGYASSLSAISLVDDHGWPDIYSRLKKLYPTSITAYRVRSLFLLVADEFIGVILSGEGIVSGIPFSMQICIVPNGGVMEASHISIMPTSVKYFFISRV
ncbi:hypothetical protein [Escherichia coli]|uniref:hypothetical protein n=2 Tax=Escherichia coli TaxID=562 RepID=UPI001BE1F0D4|nr:hypothetical protein [Escherichia coli]EJY0665918.1 hypothetical protein [Escherichia coli]MCS1111584.1 hypothetical protein [Escherichia coli]MCU6999229.1 hypothetical protein [Escherichia coli]MCU7028211.1 hypothetical protein [Escherichia coli]MCU7056446.1 hypothetical protein [Escherichia coli]